MTDRAKELVVMNVENLTDFEGTKRQVYASAKGVLKRLERDFFLTKDEVDEIVPLVAEMLSDKGY